MRLTSVSPRRGVTHTPLRYPGGKTRLASFLSRLIEGLDARGCTYLEPYAGGAGAALSLLADGTVKRIVINDLDPRINAFWRAITNQPDEFMRLFEAAPVTLKTWHQQRERYLQGDTSDIPALGFATFFLNRTNRSGVMNAGVIGGQQQSGNYRIDARYNKEELRRRLRFVSDNSHRITVLKRDGAAVLRTYLPKNGTFAYVDPPYYAKGSYLYLNSLDEEAHAGLATVLRDRRDDNWVLTYDDAPEVRDLYRGLYQGTFELPYSAHVASRASERMVLSDPVSDVERRLR